MGWMGSSGTEDTTKMITSIRPTLLPRLSLNPLHPAPRSQEAQPRSLLLLASASPEQTLTSREREVGLGRGIPALGYGQHNGTVGQEKTVKEEGAETSERPMPRKGWIKRKEKRGRRSTYN